MPVPKKRHSNSRQWKRRANWKLEAPTVTRCPHCQADVRPHQVCPECGTYQGRPVLAARNKAEKER